MKIIEAKCPAHLALSRIAEGGTLRFKAILNTKHKDDDVFIVNEVCSSYRPKDTYGKDKCTGKMAITNLRTGALCYADKSRPVYPVNAEVREL